MAHPTRVLSALSRARPAMMLLLSLASLAASGCGSARRSEPLVGPVRLASEEERRGQRQFFRFCHQCHPGGDAGLGPAINNKPLPDAAIRFQIRKGIGAMPSFDDATISDRDVDAVIAYLGALRSEG